MDKTELIGLGIVVYCTICTVAVIALYALLWRLKGRDQRPDAPRATADRVTAGYQPRSREAGSMSAPPQKM